MLERGKTIIDTDWLIGEVIAWGKKHQLNDPIMQYAKANEEIGEIAHELTRNRYDSDEIFDAIGDTLVTLIILADILHFSPSEALLYAYEQIKDRKGITENGTFVKEQ